MYEVDNLFDDFDYFFETCGHYVGGRSFDLIGFLNVLKSNNLIESFCFSSESLSFFTLDSLGVYFY